MKKILIMIFCFPFLVHAANLEPDRLITYKSIDGFELKLHVFEPVGHREPISHPQLSSSLAEYGQVAHLLSFKNKPAIWPTRAWWQYRPSIGLKAETILLRSKR